MPSPPGANANPLVAERAFPTSDYWGRTGSARCAEEMRQESVGISNRLLTPCHTRLRRPPRDLFSYQGVSTRGVGHSPAVKQMCWELSCPEESSHRTFAKAHYLFGGRSRYFTTSQLPDRFGAYILLSLDVDRRVLKRAV